jgi:uncharacterized protein with PQ loop repeat
MNTPLEKWFAIAGVVQSCVPLVSLCAYVPQWRKLLKTRSSGSISLSSWVLWTGSYSIAVIYSSLLLMTTGKGWPMVATSSLGLVFVIFTLVLVWRFRTPPPISGQNKKNTHSGYELDSDANH